MILHAKKQDDETEQIISYMNSAARNETSFRMRQRKAVSLLPKPIARCLRSLSMQIIRLQWTLIMQ